MCMVGHLADIVTYAKFQDDIFKGYDFTGSNFPFSYCFLHGPQQTLTIVCCGQKQSATSSDYDD